MILDVSPSVTETTDEIGSAAGVKPKTRMDKVLVVPDRRAGRVPVEAAGEEPGLRLPVRHPARRGAAGVRPGEPGRLVEGGLGGVGPLRLQAVGAPRPVPGRARDGAGDRRVEGRPARDRRLGDRVGESSPRPRRSRPTSPRRTRLALQDNRAKLEKRVDVARAIVLGTNVPDSLTAAVNREAANMVQGVVVFTDGRSNLGSDSAYRTLKDRATREKIPLFTVAVGEARRTSRSSSPTCRPRTGRRRTSRSRCIVEADGVGLGDAEVEVKLDLYLPGRDPKKDAPDHELTQKLKFQGDPPAARAGRVRHRPRAKACRRR